MKKVLLFSVILLGVVFLSGCEKKTNDVKKQIDTTKEPAKKLVCSINSDEEMVKVTLTYDGTKMTKADYTTRTKYASEKEAKKKYDKDSKEVIEINKNKGISASIQQSKETITSTVSFTIDNMEEKANTMFNEIFSEIKDKSYDDAKTTLTSVNYSCN